MQPQNTQINLIIPKRWKLELERLARLRSMQEDKNVSYADLIRAAVREKYELTK